MTDEMMNLRALLEKRSDAYLLPFQCKFLGICHGCLLSPAS
jgi:hypothetical protein